MIRLNILKTLLRKEFTQFRRNSFIPRVSLVFPVVLMLVIPWVANMEVRHVSVAVVDGDHSLLSSSIVRRIDASAYLDLETIVTDFPSALDAVEKGNADVILELPSGLLESLSGIPKHVAIWANGVNAVKGSMGSRYLSETVMRAISEESGLTVSKSPSVSVKYLYNPTLEYRNFMIPAIMVMLLIIFGGVFPTLNLVGEKEAGTQEQINVSPVRPMEFVLAKLIMYWIIGLVQIGITMILARLIYALSPAGPFWIILLAAFLFMVVMSGLGIIVANHSDTMLSAIFIMVFFLMVFMLLSGLFTPVESMPDWIRPVTYILPPRYFIEIMRSTYLRGAGFADQWVSLLILTVMAVSTSLIASLSYRKQS